MIRIHVEDVSFSYEPGMEILKHISFDMKEGESIGLIGANGAGKSTLLKLLVGLNPDYKGTIQVGEYPVSKQYLPQIRAKLGYVFQDSDSQLFMSTVYEDVAFAPRNYGLTADETDQRVRQALELTGINHLRERQIHRLSGGEKKLVSIATILSMMPEVLLMDEPSIALDPRNRHNLIHVLNSLDQPKIIASHDLDMIWDTCPRTILLSDGEIVCDGATKEILCDRELLESNGLELPLRLQAYDRSCKK